MERLEKFVIQHRSELDSGVPSLKVWAEIDRKLEKKSAKKRSLWVFVRAAAAVVILLGLGSVIGANLSQSSSDSASTLADHAPEYAELESYYHQQIDQKIQQLASYQHDVYVQEDMRQLDEVFTELRKELEVAPKGAERQIIQMMIENYEAKINILERVLNKIQSTTPEQHTLDEYTPNPSKSQSNEVSL
ncbi:MAG: hypothetical protein NXI23_13100 [Bacteroidetes bacterium]|jgi:predicted PurR-regulated permease PerM|nr:hypothetical protein [Bacteroidota bacterium]